jgi:hypothetical protein
VSDGETIREGMRRIGSVVEELVALYGTLTGQEQPRARSREAVTGPQEEAPGGRVVRMPERRRRAGGA